MAVIDCRSGDDLPRKSNKKSKPDPGKNRSISRRIRSEQNCAFALLRKSGRRKSSSQECSEELIGSSLGGDERLTTMEFERIYRREECVVRTGKNVLMMAANPAKLYGCISNSKERISIEERGFCE